MNTLLKVFVVLILVGGIWVWMSGKSVTRDVVARAEANASLSAAPILALKGDYGAFDETGTIILDETEGQGGLAYILYTEYAAQGDPKVKTKRLVFQNQDECGERNLPCATNQPGVPLVANEKVRIVGVVKDELVEVSQAYRL